MSDLTLRPTRADFTATHAAMQDWVDRDILAGVSSAVLQGTDLIDLHCAGWADKEAQIPLRPDHLFRVFSSTKLITSCAVLLLMQDGLLKLDDPIERFIAQLGNRRVLLPGARRLDETEAARSSITVRHLLSHSAGLSYGIFDPGTPMFVGYNERQVRNPNTTLAAMMDALADLPLSFHPGTNWEYSVATDVLSRLVEVVSGKTFDVFIAERILGPLGMRDTGFVVPEDQQHRLVAYYEGASVLDPLKPGLTRSDDAPYPQAYRKPFARLSGGGGLVSSLPDQIALIRALMPGSVGLLEPPTLQAMMSNQLPEGRWINFLGQGQVRGKGFGLSGAVTLAPSSIDSKWSIGELQWGGIAGTHWWISPRHGLAGLVMAQRQMAFWHPFSFDIKRRVYAAVLGE